MLLTLLQATAQASNAASRINVEQILDRLLNWGIEVGKDILAAIIIYIIGRFIIKQISRLVSKILEKRKLEISVQTFLKSLLSILLNLILAFAIISKLGVETTSFAAILASAGVAIGMALSGNLSNFAGGLIIRCQRNRKRDSDFPYHSGYGRQPNYLRTERCTEQQCHHQLQQTRHAPR